jgi:hypothetical protein
MLNILTRTLASSSQDDSTSLQSATELSELLLMSAEDNFSGFPYSEFLAACAELLHREHNPELMVWSARCLTNVVEAMPRAAGYIAQNSGLIAELCAKLMNIEYMELAEQSLLVLFQLSCFVHSHVLKFSPCFNAGSANHREGTTRRRGSCKRYIGSALISGILSRFDSIHCAANGGDSISSNHQRPTRCPDCNHARFKYMSQSSF